jgi:hypothetical protein
LIPTFPLLVSAKCSDFVAVKYKYLQHPRFQRLISGTMFLSEAEQGGKVRILLQLPALLLESRRSSTMPLSSEFVAISF